jgi:hypothetical protein
MNVVTAYTIAHATETAVRNPSVATSKPAN